LGALTDTLASLQAQVAAMESALAALRGATCGAGHLTPSGACFVPVPAGTYTRGSPDGEADRGSDETQHEVTLTRGFLIQRTEVTQREWRALMGNAPSNHTGCDACPVEMVSWWDALAYCNALSAAEGLETCYGLSECTGTPGRGDYTCTILAPAGGEGALGCEGYRLPTEAEWEYAARAGFSGRTYGLPLDDVAWWTGNSGGESREVALKRPNAWGLFDMLGSVWEWTWDRTALYPDGPATDPTGSGELPSRILRGCAWDSPALGCRSANRDEANPLHHTGAFGLRPARSSR
jgi:formylglycine-generating enzyme required for sulfatase activity